MNCLLCSILVLLYSSGITSQMSLTESGGDVRMIGKSLKLVCKVSGFSSSEFNIHWFQQPPGGGLEWIAMIGYDSSQTNYKQSVKGRFTISRDDSRNMIYLQMNNLIAEDTGMYYCGRHMSLAFDYWGKGTFVTVTKVAKSSLSVFPVASCGEAASKGEVRLGCSAKYFFPEALIFNWSSQPPLAVQNFKQFPSVLNPDGTYAISSQITVPYTTWESQAVFFCEVEHSESPKLKKEVPKPEFDKFVPKVFISLPSKEEFSSNCTAASATLVCLIKCFYPSTISIAWFKNNIKVKSGVITHTPIKDQEKTFHTSSLLSITLEEWKKDTVFTCLVSHSTGNITKSVTGSADCHAEAVVQVFIQPPSAEDLLLEKSAKITCIVSGLDSPKPVSVSWAKGSTSIDVKAVTYPPVLQLNNTFSVKSVLTICPDEWYNGETFECTVEHETFPTPRRVSIRKKSDVPHKKPTVFLVPPSSEEVFLHEFSTLVCIVKGFHPRAIFVKWLENGEPVPKENVRQTDEFKENTNESFTMYSMLLIESGEWNRGASYSCVVGHEALPLQITSRRIDKSFGKPT